MIRYFAFMLLSFLSFQAQAALTCNSLATAPDGVTKVFKDSIPAPVNLICPASMPFLHIPASDAPSQWSGVFPTNVSCSQPVIAGNQATFSIAYIAGCPAGSSYLGANTINSSGVYFLAFGILYADSLSLYPSQNQLVPASSVPASSVTASSGTYPMATVQSNPTAIGPGSEPCITAGNCNFTDVIQSNLITQDVIVFAIGGFLFFFGFGQGVSMMLGSIQRSES